MNITQIKENLKDSTWVSNAVEVRPSAVKNPDGSIKPFYLSRTFQYMENDKFSLEIINSADPFGKIPLFKISIIGHITWQGEHPIADGAQKADFVADESYELTPLNDAFSAILNQAAVKDFDKWQTNSVQSILKKEFTPFGLAQGQLFAEFDLIYLSGELLYWGARHVDGRGFEKEEYRPTNLQIPMIRKK